MISLFQLIFHFPVNAVFLFVSSSRTAAGGDDDGGGACAPITA
jgi:hypothetical protein